MRKWRSHKIVEAEPITGWSMAGPNVAVGAHDIVEVPASFFSRGTPTIGDYLVRYADGYLSWSPKAAFEDGYTEIGKPSGLSVTTAITSAVLIHDDGTEEDITDHFQDGAEVA